MAWMQNNNNKDATMNNNNNNSAEHDDMSISSSETEGGENRSPEDIERRRRNREEMLRQEQELLLHYDNVLAQLEEQERRDELQRNAILIDDSSSSDDSSDEDDDHDDTDTARHITEIIDMARFFPNDDTVATTLSNLQTRFETTFRLYCAKERHPLPPPTDETSISATLAIQQWELLENDIFRIAFHGRSATVAFAKDYIFTIWLERSISYHNWCVTRDYGRSLLVPDVPTPLGVHLVRVLRNIIDSSVGIVVEQKEDVNAVLREVLQHMVCTILVQTNGQTVTHTDHFQRIKGPDAKTVDLGLKCLEQHTSSTSGDKNAMGLRLLWDLQRVNKERCGILLPQIRQQVDDEAAADQEMFDLLARAERDIDEAIVKMDDTEEDSTQQPEAQQQHDDDGDEQQQPMDDVQNVVVASPVVDRVVNVPSNTATAMHPQATSTTALQPQLKKVVDESVDVKIGGFPKEQSHFRHFRTKMVPICGKELEGTGLLKTCYFAMWKTHTDQFGENCYLDCPCVYNIPSLFEPYISANVTSTSSSPNDKKEYVPSGFVDNFVRNIMPVIRQWYPNMNATQHVHQVTPLWSFHKLRFGNECKQGCRCRQSVDLFRTVDYKPLAVNDSVVGLYSRTHFEFKCNPLIAEEFGADKVLLAMSSRWWKLHLITYGALCNDSCTCVAEMPAMHERVVTDLRKEDNPPKISGTTAGLTTQFLGRFFPKLASEYPDEKTVDRLGRLMEMWQIHKLHLRFGRVCRPACKCDEAWETLFEKGVRTKVLTNAVSPAAVAEPNETGASNNNTVPEAAHTVDPLMAEDLDSALPVAALSSRTSSPIENRGDNEPVEVDVPLKKRKPTDTSASVSKLGEESLKTSAVNNKRQKLSETIEQTTSPGTCSTPEVNSIAEESKRTEQPTAQIGWEDFQQKFKRVVFFEYGTCGINSTAVMGQMWRKHKLVWGESCPGGCPCVWNIPRLTETAISELTKKPKWSHVKVPNYPVGFAGTFASRFTELVREKLPNKSSEEHLACLLKMWEIHKQQRSFGVQCCESCSCLEGWDMVFLPVLFPEERIQRKRKSLESQTPADRESSSVSRQPGSKWRPVPDKATAAKRQAYEVQFDCSKPLGIYCVTQEEGRNSICKVISRNPFVGWVDERISLGTTALESKFEGRDWVGLRTSCDLKREFNDARDNSTQFTIKFINTNVTEQTVSACDHWGKTDWDSSGRWIGKCKSGWDGHLPALLPPNTETIRPVEHIATDPVNDQLQGSTGIRFAVPLEQVRWFDPNSFAFSSGRATGQSFVEGRSLLTSSKPFADEVRDAILHLSVPKTFEYLQQKHVIAQFQRMKPLEMTGFCDTIRRCVKNNQHMDGSIDLKHKAFKICINAIRLLSDSKMLKSWERFHVVIRRVNLSSRFSGNDLAHESRKLRVEVLNKKEGEDPHTDGATFSDQPLDQCIVYPNGERTIPVNFNAAEPKVLIFKLSILYPAKEPEFLCNAITKLEDVNSKMNSSAHPRGSPMSYVCYEDSKAQDVSVRFDVTKVRDPRTRERKRDACRGKLNSVTEWMVSLRSQLQSRDPRAPMPLPRILMHLLDASIDAEDTQLAKRLLDLGTDPSWAKERVQQYGEGDAFHKHNVQHDEFSDGPEPASGDPARDIRPANCAPDVTAQRKFFQELASLLDEKKIRHPTIIPDAPRIDTVDRHSPATNTTAYGSLHEVSVPDAPRRQLSTDLSSRWAPQEYDRSLELPILENSWLDKSLKPKMFCFFAPLCMHGSNCRYIHRILNTTKVRDPPVGVVGPGFPMSEDTFSEGLDIMPRRQNGCVWWTARYFSGNKSGPKEMYFCEKQGGQKSNQGLWWYRSKQQAVDSLRERIRIYRHIQRAGSPQRRGSGLSRKR